MLKEGPPGSERYLQPVPCRRDYLTTRWQQRIGERQDNAQPQLFWANLPLLDTASHFRPQVALGPPTLESPPPL